MKKKLFVLASLLALFSFFITPEVEARPRHPHQRSAMKRHVQARHHRAAMIRRAHHREMRAARRCATRAHCSRVRQHHRMRSTIR